MNNLIPSKQAIIRSSAPDIKVDYFNDEELQEISRRISEYQFRLGQERKRYFLLFKFLLRTGGRISEILQLTPRDIDLTLNVVKMPTLKRKKKKHREIPIHQDLRDTYMQYLLEFNIPQKDPNRLFPMTRQAVDQFFKKICQPDIKIHAHKFRHIFAVKAILSGVALNEVQKWLGHSSIWTTSIYTEIMSKDTQDDMTRLN